MINYLLLIMDKGIKIIFIILIVLSLICFRYITNSKIKGNTEKHEKVLITLNSVVLVGSMIGLFASIMLRKILDALMY